MIFRRLKVMENVRKHSYDIIVVGAGPAGLSAAKSAAANGASVQVFEKSYEIGWPIKSSGGSFVSEMRELEVPESLYHPVHRIRLITQSKTVSYDYESPEFCVLDVRGLYQFLAEEAAKVGAVIQVGTEVLSPIVSGNEVAGVVVRESTGVEREVTSPLVIDASGQNAVIARAVGLHDGFSRFGIGVEFEMLAPEYDQDEVLLLYGSAFAPSGYGWAFPRGKDRVRIGVGLIYPNWKGDPDTHARGVVEEVRRRVRASRRWSILELHRGTVPSQNVPERTVAHGLIAVGDSAGQALCLAGEGIRFAMKLGRAAGTAASAAVANPESADSVLERYESDWRSNYELSYKTGYMINKKLTELPDEKWVKYLELVENLTPDQFATLLKGEFNGPVSTKLLTSLTVITSRIMELGENFVNNLFSNR